MGGSNLNVVSAWLLGATPLTVVSAYDTSVTLLAPAAATSGTLRFVDSNANSVDTSHTLHVYVPITVSQLSPMAQVIGQPVTIAGTGLDAVTTVRPSSATSATIMSKTAASLTFIVPVYAGSGPIALSSSFEQRVTTSQSLSITPGIWFGWLTRLFSGGNLIIVVNGGNLDQVSSATVGGVQASLSNPSSSSLTLTVPSAIRGPIALNSTTQPPRNAGAIDVISGGSTTFLGMVFGQVLEEQADSPQQRLTPGKPTSVRAFIAGSAAGIASPVVTLTASNGPTTLGTLTMTGPNTLPTMVSGSDSSETFNAVLPGAWVSPGLTLQISYVPVGSQLPLSITGQPSVGSSTNLNLVLVPIRIGSSTGSVPSAPFAVRDLLAMSFPYAHADINVSTRTALAITGLTNLLTSSDVSRVLAEIETARALENPGAVYYGFVADAVMQARLSSGRRFIGVAHVNDPDNPSDTWKLSALGTDSMLGLGVQDSLGLPWTWWARIMIHELGHVHSRHHAPCGDAGGADPNFPYSNGALGTQPIYASFYSDATFGSVGAPTILGTTTSMKDVMGYCEGVWFSDYNYYYVQRFAERYSGATHVAAAGARTASSIRGEGSFLVLSGEIDSRGVTLRPAFLSPRVIGDANSPTTGHDIVIRTSDNNEFTQNFTPYVRSEIPNSVSFRVSVPAGSRISRVQVRKAGIPISNTIEKRPPPIVGR